jgi:CheY-like chemotaxis protein/predicted regulator of Ras-like GTPase activity (Roadblock/LC7/MglB family)
MSKRILIVDDEESVVFFLGENLSDLGAEYEVETACSGEKALEKISTQHFDLVITDLRMPGVDGLELVEQVQARCPQTRLILMTAFGSNQVEAEAHRLQVYRYITKPFRVEDLVDAARQALGEMAISQNGVLVLSDERFEAVTRCLSDLRFEIGAQCILLADIMGQLITQVGLTTGLEVDILTSLVGGGFATTFEMARRLRQDRAFNLNYQEGNRYDVYSSNVGDNLFLTVVYDKRARSSRIGLVWLYTKRAIEKLLEITAVVETARAGELLTDDFGASLSRELDALFDDVPASPLVEASIPGVEQHQDVREELPADQPTSTFSLEQAIRAGLLDERFACDE